MREQTTSLREQALLLRYQATPKGNTVLNKTETAPEIFGEIASRAFTEAFAACCTSALEAVPAPGVPESLPAMDKAIWFCLSFEGSLGGRAYVAVQQADLPALDLRDAGGTPQSEATAMLNLLQTMTARLRELVMSRYGATTVAIEQETRPVAPQGSVLEISARSAQGDPRATLWVCLEAPLVTGLQVSSEGLFPEAAPDLQISAENFDLVLDVELDATLRFGHRQLSLREILELTSGSVVELDRQVDEPVELILDGRIIARGEAVIIDGNYGMRITEILQPVNGIVRSRQSRN